MEGELPTDINQCEQELANDFKKLFLSEEFCDVEFEIEGKILKAHRNILAIRSLYFKGLLCESLKSNRLLKPIHIEHISYDAFKSLIMYLYTNHIEVNTNPKIVCELMRNGNTYNIESLYISCIEFIEDILDTEKILDIYKYSTIEEPELTEVKELCLKFIALHFHDIIKKHDFQELPQKHMIAITQYYAKNRRS